MCTKAATTNPSQVRSNGTYCLNRHVSSIWKKTCAKHKRLAKIHPGQLILSVRNFCLFFLRGNSFSTWNRISHRMSVYIDAKRASQRNKLVCELIASQPTCVHVCHCMVWIARARTFMLAYLCVCVEWASKQQQQQRQQPQQQQSNRRKNPI